MRGFLRRLLAPDKPQAPAKLLPVGEETKPDWKTKASEAIARAKAAEAEAKQQAKRAEKFRLAAERMEKRTTEFDALLAQLKSVEHELAVAREHLMAVEVKLDILEGAANVLDLRTRAAIARQPSETGARA